MQNRLFEFLINKTGQKNTLELTPIWLNENGENDPVKALDIKQNTTPRTLTEHLFGRTMTSDNQSVDPKTGEAKLETISNYKPGFFDNLNAGINENYNTDFSVNNLAPRGKSFGYKLGEGLGSIAKGLAGWGGDAFTAGYQGLDAGLNRQGIRVGDQLYKNDLIKTQQLALQNNPEFAKLPEEQKQIQLQAIADNINNMRGYLNKDIYGNLINSQQLRDNAAWRKMYFDAQQQNLKEQQEWRKQQAEMQRAENAANRAVQIRGQDLNFTLGKERLINNSIKNDEGFGDIEQQLNNFQATFKNMPSKAESYTLGALRSATGTQTEEEANFNAQRTLLFNQIARKLGGEKGVLSDADIKRIEAALPTLTDSYQQKMAKMRAVYDLLDIKRGQTPRSQTYTSGKYTIRIK